MKVRRTGYVDYGMTEKEAEEWMEKCQCADFELEQMMLQAVHESCEAVAAELFCSMRTGISYDKLFELRYIPASKVDFYGYRRKALFLLKEKVIQSNDVVQKYYMETGNKRRFCDIREASFELRLSDSAARRVAQKANAIVWFGRFVRIDMTKLYAYIDRQTEERKNTDEIERQKGYGDHGRKEPDSGNSVQQDGTF